MLENYLDLESLMPNQCCSILFEGRSTLAIYKRETFEFVFVPKPSKPIKGKGVRPRNDSQSFAYALALDPEIHLLTLLGRAGAGKTLMALLAAQEQLGRVYRRTLVYRPIYEVGGKELGYLPGDINKKFGPWARPILDNLELIFENGEQVELITSDDVTMGEDNIDISTERGHIQISPIMYIRGRSLHDSFVIVDEAQNLSPTDVKSLVTRAGRGTKVIITGDPTQIDNRYLDAGSNGLVQAIRKFSKKRWDKFAHINMEKSERSELADIAADIL
jgi:PhoH-like ATPase